MMQYKSNQAVELIKCIHENDNLQKRAEEIIRLRHSALHDQVKSLEKKEEKNYLF